MILVYPSSAADMHALSNLQMEVSVFSSCPTKQMPRQGARKYRYVTTGSGNLDKPQGDMDRSRKARIREGLLDAD